MVKSVVEPVSCKDLVGLNGPLILLASTPQKIAEPRGTGKWTARLRQNLLPERRTMKRRTLISIAGFLFLFLQITFPQDHIKSGQDTSRIRLRITTYPADAEVFVDGINRGHTPFLSNDISQGMHFVEVRKGGYSTFHDSVGVTNEETAEISVRLSLLGGLRIITDPAGARVYLDTVFVGFSPATIPDIRPGSYRLRLELPEFQAIARQVVVTEGDTLEMRVSMASDYGTLRLIADPGESMILVDGDSVGIGAVTGYRLHTGRHTVEVRNPRFPTGIEHSLFIGPGAEVNLTARMGVTDIGSLAAAILLPGYAQLRDGSVTEGFAIAIAGGAIGGLLVYHGTRYLGDLSDYNALRNDYLGASTEALAVQLHFQLEESRSHLLERRRNVLGLVLALSAVLAYNLVDVILNHQFTVNVLEPARGQTTPGPMGEPIGAITIMELKVSLSAGGSK